MLFKKIFKQYQIFYYGKMTTFHVSSGDAVLKNLLRNGFTVSAVCDINPEKCTGYDPAVQVKSSPKDVAEESEIIISGIIIYGHFLVLICRYLNLSKYLEN